MNSSTPEKSVKMDFYEKLTQTIATAIASFDDIDAARKLLLTELADNIVAARKNRPTQLLFICTHNSRRSHLAQLWAATAAAHYGIKNIETYSGGTEATAFNIRAVAAIERAGFKVLKAEEKENPHYTVQFAETGPPMTCFSKKYSDEANPKSNFIAVMVCSDADKSCPIVEAAAKRIAIPYIDPKISDGTSEEAATYDERSLQIACEMFFVMQKVAAELAKNNQ